MNVPDRLRAIADEVEALLRGPIISAVPRPQDAAARYLAENPDVAQHIYFGRHPLEHWQIHGQKEGRRWPDMPEAAPVTRAPEASEWPAGAYQFQPGVWYVPHDATQAGPFANVSEWLEWKRKADEARANSEQADRTGAWKVPGRGSIPVTSLSRDDAAYVYHRSHDYKLKTNGDLFRDLCSGSHDDIARGIMLGDTVNPGMKAWTPDNQALIAAVDRLFT